MKLTQFATAGMPIRCSALPLLVACPARATLMFLALGTDEGGKAANIGSATHKAIEAWHANGQDAAAALATMKEHLDEYPLADLNEARLHFQPYTKDPRNRTADIVLCEKKVSFVLDPAAFDPTQEKIHVTGTLDQVRRGPDGVLRLYDVKTGERLEGLEMMDHHAIQVAAYCVGAARELGQFVMPGGIIRTRGYRKRGVDASTEPPGVFWEYPWVAEDVETVLDGVRNVVAAIRSGHYWAGPGDHCRFCPIGSGLHDCLPHIRTLKHA